MIMMILIKIGTMQSKMFQKVQNRWKPPLHH
nr:MAG TPA: hypothetical protein [Caudoviricetes sp.]